MNVGMLKTEWKEVDLTPEQLTEAIRQGWNPRFIDGLTVIGQCDLCSAPILENESYKEDRKGEMQCSKHSE